MDTDAESRTAPVALGDALGLGVLGVACVATFAAAVAWNAAFLHDDALITLRYAQNWLAGNGIGWNPGDRVEGYTNFLQLLLATGLGAAGVDLVHAVRWIGGAAGLAAVAAVGVGARRCGLLAAIPMAFVASSIPLVVWVFGGLEAPLVAALVTTGVVLAHAACENPEAPGASRQLVAAGLAFGLAMLTRMDAGLFAGLALVGVALARAPGRGPSVARIAGPMALVVGPWLLWKLGYYGAVLPNTWWVKGTDPSGWRLQAGLLYVGRFVTAPPFPVLLVVIGGARALVAGRLGRADAWVLTAIAGQLAWVVYVGGDQMPASRLLVPVVPVASWLAVRLLWPDFATGGGVARGAALAAAAAALTLQVVWPGLSGPHRNATAFVGAAVGEFIAREWRPGSLVALNTAGSTPFHAPQLRYLDMLGLNDRHIARRPLGALRIAGQRLPGHAKGDGRYVLDQKPDYIILGPAAGVPVNHPWFLSDLEIGEDPRFAERYVRRRARLDVRDRPHFQDHPAARSGSLVFTWYERKL